MSPKADIDIVPLTSPPAVPEPFTGTITAEAEVDVSPHVVSLTHSHDVSVPEKRRGSGVLGGLFDMFRGRKAKREDVPMARSHSIPASIYSSTESLYVVTYKIKKRRTQSCPPRKSKGGRTHITIECDYEDATAMMAPKYITDVINSIGQETDGEKVKILQPVPYHENLLKELKDFKKDEGRDVTESHIYTTCHCETGGRVSVGVSTECDIIQHEECVGEKVVYEGETAEASCQTEPDTTDYSAEECTCQLCQALAAHLSEIALTMGVGDEPIHLYVHVCQTCPALSEE